jgi:hypothetical protein
MCVPAGFFRITRSFLSVSILFPEAEYFLLYPGFRILYLQCLVSDSTAALEDAVDHIMDMIDLTGIGGKSPILWQFSCIPPGTLFNGEGILG